MTHTLQVVPVGLTNSAQIDNEVFRECLRHLKTEHNGCVLTDTVLSQLLHLVPTDSEALMVSRFRGDRSKFRPVERFMEALADIPDRVERVTALMFRTQFDERMAVAEAPIGKFADACRQVKTSKRLRRVLKVVLDVGNRMNAQHGNEARGITLESLLKLSEVCAARCTLLPLCTCDPVLGWWAYFRPEASTARPPCSTSCVV